MKGLTLAMIESETYIKPKGKDSKPATADQSFKRKRQLQMDETIPLTEQGSDEEKYTTIGNGSLDVDNTQDVKYDWRSFFTMEEMTNAFEQI